jgi:hypothetical protein
MARVRLLAVTAAVAALAGCGATPADGGPAAPTTPPTPTVTDVPVSARQVLLTGCRPVDGGWQAEGDATNPGDDALSYPVTVYFTSGQGILVATGVAQVVIPPRATVQWRVSTAAAVAGAVHCSLPGA